MSDKTKKIIAWVFTVIVLILAVTLVSVSRASVKNSGEKKKLEVNTFIPFEDRDNG